MIYQENRMKYSEYRFTLDLQKHQSQQTIAVFRGDTAVRLYISLTDGGKPYIISPGCYAVFFGKRPDNVPLIHSCELEKNNTEIIYEFQNTTTFCEGVVNCQCRLYGADQKLISAPLFSIVVDERTVADDEEVDIPGSNLSALDEILVNENNRITAETDRGNAEATRVFNEDVRQANEANRVEAELAREDAEKRRDQAVENVDNTISNQISEHNTSEEAHGDIRELVNNMKNAVSGMLNIGDGSGESSIRQINSVAVGENSAAFGKSKVVSNEDETYNFDVSIVKGYDSASDSLITEDHTESNSGGNSSDLTPEEEPTTSQYYNDGNQILSNYSIEFNTTGARGECSHSEGLETLASGRATHAEGWHTYAVADYSHAEGSDTIAQGNDSHAEGLKNTSKGQASHTEGMRNTAEGKGSHVEGLKNHTSTNALFSHVEGSLNNVRSSNSHAEGMNNILIGSASHSHVEGEGNTVQGINSHAEGEFTIGIGKAIHTEGSYSVAKGDYSHAEGKHQQVYDDAEALDFTATVGQNETYGHITSITPKTTGAYGSYSHAEGNLTLAYGGSSHAEGFKSYAKGTYSHAEGQTNFSEGAASHSEGRLTRATAEAAHSEGFKTLAKGKYSHVEGQNTIATTDCQHVQGRFNAPDEEGKYLHIVGMGTADNKRFNAHTIDTQGNAWFKGNIKVGGTAYDDAAVREVVLHDQLAYATVDNLDPQKRYNLAVLAGRSDGYFSIGDFIKTGNEYVVNGYYIIEFDIEDYVFMNHVINDRSTYALDLRLTYWGWVDEPLTDALEFIACGSSLIRLYGTYQHHCVQLATPDGQASTVMVQFYSHPSDDKVTVTLRFPEAVITKVKTFVGIGDLPISGSSNDPFPKKIEVLLQRIFV